MTKTMAAQHKNPKANASILQDDLEPGSESRKISVAFDTDTGKAETSVTVPALVGWDDDRGQLVCADGRFRLLLLLVTGGDKKKMRDIVVKGGSYVHEVLGDADGKIRFAMMAKCFDAMMNGETEKDPLDWAKFMYQVIEGERGGVTLGGKGDKHVHIHTEGGFANQSQKVIREVLDMGEKVEDAPEAKGKPGSD